MAQLWSDEYPERRGDPDLPMPSMEEAEAIGDAHEQTYTDDSIGPVVVADGHDLAVKVKDGCLLIEDGFRAFKRTRTISPLDAADVKTVIVLGSGFITTEAFLWAFHHDVGLAVLRSGLQPTAVTPGIVYDKAVLRYAQVKSARTALGISIFRHLIERRLLDMSSIVALLDETVAAAIKRQADKTALLRTVHALQALEGSQARVYWQAWHELALRFDWPAPPHYRKFTGRRSPLAEQNRSNRHALTPVNALLNLGYKLAENQAVLAMIGHGLDPGMSVGHILPDRDRRDAKERPSGALDLLEVGRGIVERYVLELVQTRRFSRADFRRMPQGELRVGPPLSHEMVKVLVPQLRKALLEESSWLAKTLRQGR